jgi:hypothetical protein
MHFLFSDIFQRNKKLSYDNEQAMHRYSGVMVSILASSAVDLLWVDRGIDPRSGQTKDYEIDINT